MAKKRKTQLIDLEQSFLESLPAHLESLPSPTRKALERVLKMVSDARSLEEEMDPQVQTENEVEAIRDEIFKILLKILEAEPLNLEKSRFRNQVESLLKHKKTHIRAKDMSIRELYIKGDPKDTDRVVAYLEKHYDIKTVADLRRLQKNYSKYLELSSEKQRMLDKALEKIGFPTPKRS